MGASFLVPVSSYTLIISPCMTKLPVCERVSQPDEVSLKRCRARYKTYLHPLCAGDASLRMIGRKTSFDAVIESFDSDAPAQWLLKGRSLPYGRLQSCMEASTTGRSERNPQHEQATDFLSALRQEVHLIDRYVSIWLASLESQAEQLAAHVAYLCSFESLACACHDRQHLCPLHQQSQFYTMPSGLHTARQPNPILGFQRNILCHAGSLLTKLKGS